jgi:hypothetical protein
MDSSSVTVTSVYHSLYAQAWELYSSVALDVCSQVFLLFLRKSIFQCPPYWNAAQYIHNMQQFDFYHTHLKCEARIDHSVQTSCTKADLWSEIFTQNFMNTKQEY